MSGLPPEFWDQERSRLLRVLAPHLSGAAQAGAAGVNLDFNNHLGNEAAAHWASEYTDEILQRLNTTSQRLVGAALAEWSRKPGATMGELKARLEAVFSEQRADLIAVTEVTRAYAQGNKAAYLAAGISEWKWNTNRDDLVCPVCGGLNGKVMKIGLPFAYWKGKAVTEAPAHPGCRCWMTPVVPKAEAAQGSHEDSYRPIFFSTVPQWKSENQARLSSQLAQAQAARLRERIDRLRISTPLPRPAYHLDKHGQDLGVQSEAELQAMLETHLQKEKLRFFVGLNKHNTRIWYLVDEENQIISEYNELANQHYTIYRSQNAQQFLTKNAGWLVEVDPNSLQVRKP